MIGLVLFGFAAAAGWFMAQHDIALILLLLFLVSSCIARQTINFDILVPWICVGAIFCLIERIIEYWLASQPDY